MNPTHFHLAVTHLPIFGVLIGIVILLFGILRKNNTIKATAFTLFICMSLITIPVFLSGEEAEETLEELIPDSRDFIHEHEEAAEKAIWLMATLGISSLISLLALYKSLNASNIIHLMSLIIAVITFIMFMRVANLGGEIRHSEIRQSTVPVEGAILESQERHDDNDDD